jgi:hypothetical protein
MNTERNDNMDNFGVHVLARDPETFRQAFRLAFIYRTATHYAVTKIAQENYMVNTEAPTLVLYWYKDEKALPLPYEMDCEAALAFAEGWLKSASYPEEPDHDGDNEKGFLLTTGNFWAHVGGHGSIMAIQPCWALLGK